jgi:CRP-like cAMP-binding protein
MDLDLNKFRTLIPINALYDDSLLHLAENTRVEQLNRGDVVFDIGDHDTDSVFLLSGEISETTENGQESYISAGNEEALYALANFKPRQFRAEVISENATLARVDTQLLEKLLTWDQFSPDRTFSASSSDTPSGPDAAESEWMICLLRSRPFLNLPAVNIQSLFSRMEEIHASAGSIVVELGEPGDFYYIIREGRCKVSRPVGSGENVLAELANCSSFGEEALISNAPRNARVTMLTDGRLMRLSKEDFTELLEQPLLNWVTAQAATDLIAEGAIRVDVRLESEFRNSGLPNTVNIPLHQLRERAATLNKKKPYVLYCDTGQRSSAGAFLLSQLGFDVHVLKGGISGA